MSVMNLLSFRTVEVYFWETLYHCECKRGLWKWVYQHMVSVCCKLQLFCITILWNTSKPPVLEFIKIISAECMNYW